MACLGIHLWLAVYGEKKGGICLIFLELFTSNYTKTNTRHKKGKD